MSLTKPSNTDTDTDAYANADAVVDADLNGVADVDGDAYDDTNTDTDADTVATKYHHSQRRNKSICNTTIDTDIIGATSNIEATITKEKDECSTSTVNEEKLHICPCHWKKCHEYASFFHRTDDLYKGMMEVELSDKSWEEEGDRFSYTRTVRQCIEKHLDISHKKDDVVEEDGNDNVSNDEEGIKTQRYRIALHHFSREYVLDAKRKNSSSSCISRRNNFNIVSMSIDAATADRYGIPKETCNEYYRPSKRSSTNEKGCKGEDKDEDDEARGKKMRYIIAPSNSENHVKNYIEEASKHIDQSILIAALMQKRSTEKFSIAVPPGKLQITCKSLLNVGIYVERVKPASPIVNILHNGDIILEFNRIPLHDVSLAKFANMISPKKPSLSSQQRHFTVVPAHIAELILTALHTQLDTEEDWFSNVGMATKWKTLERKKPVLYKAGTAKRVKLTEGESNQLASVAAKITPRDKVTEINAICTNSNFDKDMTDLISFGEIPIPVLDGDCDIGCNNEENDNNTEAAVILSTTTNITNDIEPQLNNDAKSNDGISKTSLKKNGGKYEFIPPTPISSNGTLPALFLSHSSLMCLPNEASHGLNRQSSSSASSKLHHEQYLLQHVAKMFRQHAMLYLKQATYLEDMSCYPNNPSKWGIRIRSSMEDLDDKIKREKTVDLVKKSYESMIKMQRRIDSMLDQDNVFENPWMAFKEDVGRKISREPECIRLKTRQRLGHKCSKLSKYIGRRKLEFWKSLSLKEKKYYLSSMAPKPRQSQCIT